MKKFFAILAFLTVAIGSFAQEPIRITTDCKITKPLLGFLNVDEDVDSGPALIGQGWRVQIEWMRFDEGGVCRVWVFTGESKLLAGQWASSEYLQLYKTEITDESDPITLYQLTDGVFTFFTIAVNDSGYAFCRIETKEI